VLWQNACLGTQKEEGIRFVERIMTALFATCKKQDRNVVFEFLNKPNLARPDGHSASSPLPSGGQTN